MNPFNLFRQWEHKYALTFVGFVLAVIGLWYTVTQQAVPSLRMEIVSNAKVIDVKEDVGKLEVLFEGANLRSNRQTLAVVTLRISNDGTAPIPIGAYDTSAPIGIRLAATNSIASAISSILLFGGSTGMSDIQKSPNGAVITKAELIVASTDYLSKHLMLDASTNEVTFRPVILDPGDYFSVKLLVLHDEKSELSITPIGKVAGVKAINFVGLDAKEVPPSFWEQAFAGNVWVQIVRTATYFLAVPIAFVLIIGPIAGISSYRETNKRRTQVASYRKSSSALDLLLNKYEWVLDSYVNDGPSTVIRINKLLEFPKRLRLVKKASFRVFYQREKSRLLHDFSIVRKLEESGAVTVTDKEVKIDEGFQKLMKDFTTNVLTGITSVEGTDVIIDADVIP